MRALGRMATDPVGIARHLGRAGHDQELVAPQPGDGEVTLEGAAIVQHHAVDGAAHRHGNIVGTKTLQHGLGIAALHQQLAERGLVGDRHALAGRAMLGGDGVEPRTAAPAILHLGHIASAREPVGPLPAHLVAEPRAARLQAIVERRAAERAAALLLALRPRHLVV